VPELIDLPAGCPFAERCALAVGDCRVAVPAPVQLARCMPPAACGSTRLKRLVSASVPA